MKLAIRSAAAASLLVLAALGSQTAAASQALAQQNACLACHAVDRKLVGPAFRDIAKKYAGQADAEAQLVRSIKAGGAGKWGPVPMPAQPALDPTAAQALAAWVLGGAQ